MDSPMVRPTPFSIDLYVGTLERDDSDRETWFGYSDAAGNTQSILMLLDPSPTGAFDPTEVTNAWTYFSQTCHLANGAALRVYGFVAVPPGATQPMLHVVRA
jgi:hypothetical protein